VSPRLARLRGRVAALALLAAGLGAVHLLVVQPIVAAYRAADEEIARAETMLARLREIGGSRGALEGHLAGLRTRAASQTAYLDTASDALAAAELQELVKRLVLASGGRLLSTVTLPAEAEPPFRKIAIQARLEVDIAAAQQVFHALDAGGLLVFVDNLVVRGPRRAPSDDAAAAVSLDVRFDLYGYARLEAS
jgi:hypothetical protein